MPKKIYEYKVTPSHHGNPMSFPTDMLRTDRAWPSTSEDAVKLSHACSNAAEFVETWGVGDRPATVGLCSYDHPQGDRWVSFGWQICFGKVEERTI
jgi:hypothetical protein